MRCYVHEKTNQPVTKKLTSWQTQTFPKYKFFLRIWDQSVYMPSQWEMDHSVYVPIANERWLYTAMPSLTGLLYTQNDPRGNNVICVCWYDSWVITQVCMLTADGLVPIQHQDISNYQVSEWVIKFNGLSRTADSEVHIVHISRVIIACTLKSISSPT